MNKNFILLALILLVISGCSNSKTEVDKNKGLEFIGFQSGIGAADNTNTFDKQKLQYDITISNKKKMKFKKESIEMVLTDWIKQNQMDNKITKITFDNENIIIKGYVSFDATGLTKEDIVKNEPFIDGVNIVTDDGEKIFLKQQFH